ncbi:galactoside alpha-(1,2)-fucosyltransferase 2-like [Gigantopelta aegis]|uniref:galactoside alpha-(1,2)-fucosyltransferase 2-like n=1 Tax=Gigantopelta aegis TaxID=1735272 RepID=UPI001B887ED7|nr:galactoside alpha-(1,2)-fucosyltransferase 2-like [Gigantopelta aegis]
MAVIKNRMLNYIFELDATKVDECACAKITRLDPKWCCAYDDTLLRFKPETNYQLGNYLQSWKYFHNHTADIRRQFTFNNSTAAKALAFLNGVMDKYKERTSDWSNSADIENITFVGVHVRRVGNSPEVDMCILSSCNHSIMTVGTFGWWASFLAGGETVHYKHLARKGSILRKQYSSDYKDYFYPGWIGMD